MISLFYKCEKCKKKSYMTVECKCKHKFCNLCSHPESHNCEFDYKAEMKKILTKNNPIIVQEKLVRF